MLTPHRLRTAKPGEVAFCPTCRREVPDALDTEPDDGLPLRCLACGDALELATIEITEIDVSGVDYASILEDVGLPADCATFDRLTCTHFVPVATVN
jgi:hypothetical protein